jgi:hypothetical protein
MFLYLFVEFVQGWGKILIQHEESSFPLTHYALEHLSFVGLTLRQEIASG